MKIQLKEIGVNRFIEFCLTNNLKDILLVGLKDDIKNKIIAAASGILLCTVPFTERSGNGKTIKWICIFTGEAV